MTALRLIEGDLHCMVTSLPLVMSDPKLASSLVKLRNKENSWFEHLMSYESSDVIVLVAFWKKKIPVGLCMVRNDRQKASGYFVSPRYRRRGIGSFLLKNAAHLLGKGLLCRPRPGDEVGKKFFMSNSRSRLGLRIAGTRSWITNRTE